MVFFTTHSPAGLAKPFLACAWLMAASRRLTVEVLSAELLDAIAGVLRKADRACRAAAGSVALWHHETKCFQSET